jgi:hypothetical protein
MNLTIQLYKLLYNYWQSCHLRRCLYIYIWMHQLLFSWFLVLFGCIDVQYLNIALILNTETTLNQNVLIFILCLDILKTYCWCYHFDLLIFPISKVHSSFTITVNMCAFTLFFYCYFTFAPLNADFRVKFRATYRRLMPLLKF